MTSIEQLETLKRQVEEDFKLDIAAIERLQRRFLDGRGMGKMNLLPVESQPAMQQNSVSLPTTPEPRKQQQPDELSESLRTMFSSYRK
jgi:hypothetical protein